MNKQLKYLSFKSVKNTRVFCSKGENGEVYISIRRIIPKEDLDNFKHFEVVKTFSNSYLIETTIGLLEETFSKIMLFKICGTIEDFEYIDNNAEKGIRFSVQKLNN